MDLQQIVKRCQLGEKEAFRELLEGIEKEALATAYLISGTRGIAEDIVQEAYLKCFREIKNLREPQVFKVWFFRILVRTGWEMTKKHSRIIPIDTASLNMTEAEGFGKAGTEEGTLLTKGEAEPETLIDTGETKAIVRKAVSSLSDNLKTVVILYYFNDMSIDEISKVLGCLKSTVKSRLFYGRAALRKQLGGCFEDSTFPAGRELQTRAAHFEEMDIKECKANG